MTKILAFAGSSRTGSFHKALVKIAAQGAEAAGAEVTLIDLGDYPMPLYNQDLEAKEGFPDSVLAFKKLLKSHHGLLIASPEYNSSITPLLKNAIDWASRPEEGEPPLSLTCFRGKVAALMATSPGGMGGLRGLVHVRDILQNIGVIVIPQQKTISGAYQAFNEQGQLIDAEQDAAVREVGKALATVSQKLHG
ncbi:NAD(P)H-dependent oxidoreductase [Phormidium yuhuli AB48]|uniref:NAD(P)H-dependent oxidoreductase n=1 Tax=Phormidium yuhuli AB48 TaxID=2940671 RepID=A0ABY5AN48_9CYAN|nr:NAD(P)H-dependent oxidoreductase [Phormidium yuhuli]USR90628.1 NAD(P)H-dependent oxidoreductase [Phormidium yuhuli AB48]